MARYELSLCKAKMYKLVSDYRTDLPKMCRCEFSHCGSSYWMEYSSTSDDYYRIRVTVMVCLGHTSIRVVDMSSGDELYREHLLFSYLQERGLLKEVA